MHCVGIGIGIDSCLDYLYRKKADASSGIHRAIKNAHFFLCRHVGIENSPLISRA